MRSEEEIKIIQAGLQSAVVEESGNPRHVGMATGLIQMINWILEEPSTFDDTAESILKEKDNLGL